MFDEVEDKYGSGNNNGNQNHNGGGGYQNNRQGNNGGGYGDQRRGSTGGGYQGGGNNGYQGGNRNNGGGYQGGNRGGGGGGGNRQFVPKPEPDFAYLPVAIVLDDRAPSHVVQRAAELAKRLVAAGYTVRSRGACEADKAVIDAVGANHPQMELHLPFKNFNGMESKIAFQGERTAAVGRMVVQNWDAMANGEKPVQALFAGSYIRTVMGQKGNSIALALITWSEDQAEQRPEVSTQTGKQSTAIMTANMVRIPVFNLARGDAQQRFCDRYQLNN